MRRGSERQRAEFDLVRQLSRALSAYRLFPDDPQQPAFVAAVERVSEASKAALAVGTAHFEIRSGEIRGSDGLLPDDDQVRKLGLACFERQIEHLHVLSAPDASELATFGRVLSLSETELAEAGGPHALLERDGVVALRFGSVNPDQDADAQAALDQLTPEQRELWERLQDPERMVSNLLVEGFGRDVARAAQDLYRRFRALHAVLPEQLTGRGDFFGRIKRILDLLPDELSREFTATTVTRITDQFANGFLTSLTDTAMTEALVGLAEHQGPDPVDLAKTVVAGTGRPDQLIAMIEATVSTPGGNGESGGGMRPTAAAIARTDDSQVGEAISDALSRRLLDERDVDAAYIREHFPQDVAALAELARVALRDYLHAEEDVDRLERVLRGWVLGVGQAAAGFRLDEVGRLLELIDPPLEAADPDSDKAARLREARDAVVSPDLVAAMLTRAPEDAEHSAVQGLLGGFGNRGIDAVLDLLATEENRGARAQLVGLATRLAPGHLERLRRRLDDPRWYVVRNLVTILGRLGTPDVVPDLVALMKHPQPAVRRELVRSLVACAGSSAASHIRRLVDDPDASVRSAALSSLAGISDPAAAKALADIVRHGRHLDDQRRALRLLADHPDPGKLALLDDLASRRARPKLPRLLRRPARAAAREARNR